MASSDSYMASIQLWPSSIIPYGWIICSGQLLSIDIYSALYSLLLNTYGGDYVASRTFALPDMRGRAPLCVDPNSKYYLGSTGGIETVSLYDGNLPSHTHTAAYTPIDANEVKASVAFPVQTDSAGGGNNPQNKYFGVSGNTNLYYSDTTEGSTMGEVIINDIYVDIRSSEIPVEVKSTGESENISILQPYIVLNFIICNDGIYPQRS